MLQINFAAERIDLFDLLGEFQLGSIRQKHGNKRFFFAGERLAKIWMLDPSLAGWMLFIGFHLLNIQKNT